MTTTPAISMNVVVDRTQWARAKKSFAVSESELSTLFYSPHPTRPETQMGCRIRPGLCCLGFACRTLGIPDNDMEGVCYPCYLSRHHTDVLVKSGLCEKPAGSLRKSTYFSGRAAQINDDLSTSDAEKEALLTAHFVENGHTITFIN